MSLDEWKELLFQWSKDILGNAKYKEYVPADAIDKEQGRIGYPGADEFLLAEAESRLGVALPNSYKEFLKITNGWPIAGQYVERILPVQEIDWFATKSREWIEAWRYGLRIGLNEGNFSVLKKNLWFNEEHLDSALQISEGGFGVYLLNPQVKFEHGEWEAWVFESETGAELYRSFWELMLAEYESFLRLKDV